MPEISNFLDLNAYNLSTNKTYNIRHDPNNIHRIFINIDTIEYYVAICFNRPTDRKYISEIKSVTIQKNHHNHAIGKTNNGLEVSLIVGKKVNN